MCGKMTMIDHAAQVCVDAVALQGTLRSCPRTCSSVLICSAGHAPGTAEGQSAVAFPARAIRHRAWLLSVLTLSWRAALHSLRVCLRPGPATLCNSMQSVACRGCFLLDHIAAHLLVWADSESSSTFSSFAFSQLLFVSTSICRDAGVLFQDLEHRIQPEQG